jgi:predicted RNase H-like HicB family nuclease
MHPMVIDYSCQVWREGKQYVAHAMPLDVMSAGPTPEAARAALEEAVRLFLKTAADVGTLDEVLEEAGYRLEDGRWVFPDWVAFEKQSTAVPA